MEQISDKLKKLREKHNFKQSYVDSCLGITQQNYSRYESGKREFPIRLLPALSNLYNVSVEYILGMSMNEKDLTVLSDCLYNAKTLKEIIDDINSLNSENMSSLLIYIEFLKYKQKLNQK